MKASAPMHLNKTQKVQIQKMEAKVSKTCPGRTSSMPKLLRESKKEYEDRLKKILSKVERLGLGYYYAIFPMKKKNFIHALVFSTKVAIKYIS